MLDSIQYALDHRDQAIQYALQYARDMGADKADRFVGMYVNDFTLDYGEQGRQAADDIKHDKAQVSHGIFDVVAEYP